VKRNNFISLAIFFLFACSSLQIVYPQLIEDVPLVYPHEARIRNMEGTVDLNLFILKSGYVGNVKMLKSSGYKILDNASIAYVRKLQYTPAIVNGKVSEVWLRKTVRFEFEPLYFNVPEWVDDVVNLQKLADKTVGASKDSVHQKLFNIYLKYTNYITVSYDKNHNEDIKKVVLPVTMERWKNFWDVYPMSFIVFDDFLERYPESSIRKDVEKKLVSLLKYDLERLRLMVSFNSDFLTKRARIAKTERYIISKFLYFH